jgi:hypothetical protein
MFRGPNRTRFNFVHHFAFEFFNAHSPRRRMARLARGDETAVWDFFVCAMINSGFHSDPRHPAGKLARLIRRICLLREMGDDAAASALEKNELPSLAAGSDAADLGELSALFAAETDRAAETAMLAELIVARLTRFSSGREALAAVGPVPAESAARRAAPAATPAIADLLDAMLQHDRNAARPKR